MIYSIPFESETFNCDIVLINKFKHLDKEIRNVRHIRKMVGRAL